MADMVQSGAAPGAHGAQGGHGAHAGGDHASMPFLQHHFDTPNQQFEAGKLGMWLFLATEVLFFSGLFCAYAIYRRLHPEVFIEAHKALDVTMGAINTVVLIVSSFTMALGVWCAQKSYQRGLVICLALTLLGACGFMGIKAVEYSHKWQHGYLWGTLYNPDTHHGDHGHGDAAHAPAEGGAAAGGTDTASGDHAAAAESAVAAAPAAEPPADGAAPPQIERTTNPLPGAPVAGLTLPDQAAKDAHGSHGDGKAAHNLHIFFGIYFCMTGLHGLHVLAGMGVLTWLLIGAIRGRYNSDYYTPVDLGGLYWHLVDLVWIYLFPLLYLIH